MAKSSPVCELQPISCRLCHQEIPRAETLNIEGQEYMYYFCGYGCYAQWRRGDSEQGRHGSQ